VGKHLKNAGGWAKVFAVVGIGAECNYWSGHTSSDRGDGIGDIHLPVPGGANEGRRPLIAFVP